MVAGFESLSYVTRIQYEVMFLSCACVFARFFKGKIKYIVDVFVMILLRWYKFYHSHILNTSRDAFMSSTMPVILLRKSSHSPLCIFVEVSINFLVGHATFCFNKLRCIFVDYYNSNLLNTLSPLL